MTPALPVAGFAQASLLIPVGAFPTASAMIVSSVSGAAFDEVAEIADVSSGSAWEQANNGNESAKNVRQRDIDFLYIRSPAVFGRHANALWRRDVLLSLAAERRSSSSPQTKANPHSFAFY